MRTEKHAPVAIFTYTRLDSITKTIDCLSKNLSASDTEIYIFSDGGRDKDSWNKVNLVRKYLSELIKSNEVTHIFKRIKLIERESNYFLERNIIDGIDHIFKSYDKIIVLEDDICTSPYFLVYMNWALDAYKDDSKVMHISGFTNLDLIHEHSELIDKSNETYFTSHMSGWGWATWKDKWKAWFQHFSSEKEALVGMTVQDIARVQYNGNFPCLKSLKRNPIPWDICWELAIYKSGGLCLTPAYTLVRNIGLNNGTHFRSSRILQHYNYDRQPLSRRLNVMYVNSPTINPQIEGLFKDAIFDWGIRYTLLGKIIRFFYRKIVYKG